jgi:hypothetical protein
MEVPSTSRGSLHPVSGVEPLRAVKPSNVLVITRTNRDHAYLIDLGIARALDVLTREVVDGVSA